MREVSECWVQDPVILREEIQIRRNLQQDMVGSLWPKILEGQIEELQEILTRREVELATESTQ